MKPSELLTTARRFVDGVCAIPEISRLLPKVTDAFNGWRGARESELAGEVLKRIHEVDDSKQITELVRSSRDDYMRKWKTEETESRKLRAQLAAEREAHKETRRALAREQGDHVDTAGALGEEAGTAIRLAQENRDLLEQLSTARADLDALTRWRLQSEEPCPVDPDTDVSLCTARYGICLDKASTMIATDSWRHTPESLAAWKAREGAGDA